MSKQKEKDNGRKGGKFAIAVCMVIIILLLGTVIYLLLNRKEEPVKRNVVVNEDNVDEVQIGRASCRERVFTGV